MKVLRRASVSIRVIAFSLTVVFLGSFLMVDFLRVRSTDASVLDLPAPNQVLSTSPNFSLAQLKGLKVNPNDPYDLTFIIDHYDQKDLNEDSAQELVRYFMAALAVPAENLWVNLSPYESERIIESKLEETELGEVFLKQDYILKQLSSSLTNPDTELGKKYWSNSSDKSFDKIWISPRESELYVENNSVIINSASLKVETEADYLAMKENSLNEVNNKSRVELILEALDQEVNSGKHFAKLRQVYHALILADWFKKTLKDSVYSNYINSNELSELDLAAEDIKEKVWQLYTKSFTEGVYKTVKKEDKIKRSYFSGGVGMENMGVQNFAPNPELGNNTLSEMKIRTKDVSSSALNREAIKSSLESFDFYNGAANNDLYNLFSQSLSILIKDKKMLNGYKRGIKANDPAAIKDVLRLSLRNDEALQKLRFLLIDKIVGKNNDNLPYASMDLHRINTLINYVFLQSLGVKANYYESSEGAVLLINDLTDKRKDSFIVDLKNASVLRANQSVKSAFKKSQQTFIVKEKVFERFEYDKSDAYLLSVKKNHSEFKLSHFAARYSFFTKSRKVKELRSEILADISYGFANVDNTRFVSMLRDSGSTRYELESTKNTIANYDKSQFRSQDVTKQKKIEQNLKKAPYNKKLIRATASFYLKRKQYDKAAELFLRLITIEPLNAYNWFYRAKSLSLMNIDSQKKKAQVNAEIGRSLLVSKQLLNTIVDDSLSKGLLGLSLLNSYYHISPDMFDFDSGRPLNDIRYVLNMFRQAAKNERNSMIIAQIDVIIKKVNSGAKSISDDLEKLREFGLSGKLAIGIMKLSEKYSNYITARDAEEATRKANEDEIAKQREETRLAQEAVEAEKAKVAHSQEIIKANEARVSQYQEIIKGQGQQLTQAQATIAEKDQKIASYEYEMAILENAHNAITELDADYAEIYNDSLKYTTQAKPEGERRDFSVAATSNRSISKLGENLNSVIESYRITEDEANNVLLKTEAIYKSKNISFYQDMAKKVLNTGTEKELVFLLHNLYKNAKTKSEKQNLIKEWNETLKDHLYVYESQNTFNVAIHNRKNVPERYKMARDSEGKTALDRDVERYNVAPDNVNEKVDSQRVEQILFSIVDDRMFMLGDWVAGERSKYAISNLVGAQTRNIKLRASLAGFLKQWTVGYNSYLKTHSILEKSKYDYLTRLLKQDEYKKMTPVITQNAVQNNQELTMLMFDIDKFGDFNNKHGHAVGDQVLAEVAGVIKDHAEKVEGSYAFRAGGEEMVVLVPSVLRDSVYLAEEIRAAIENHIVKYKHKEKGIVELNVTTSLGVASIRQLGNLQGLSYDEIFANLAKKSDDFLYVAKEHGRNAVVFIDSENQHRFFRGEMMSSEQIKQLPSLYENKSDTKQDQATEPEPVVQAAVAEVTLNTANEESKLAEEKERTSQQVNTKLDKLRAKLKKNSETALLTGLDDIAVNIETLLEGFKSIETKGNESSKAYTEFMAYIDGLDLSQYVKGSEESSKVNERLEELYKEIEEASEVVEAHFEFLDNKEILRGDVEKLIEEYKSLLAKIELIPVLESRGKEYRSLHQKLHHLFDDAQNIISEKAGAYQADIKSLMSKLKLQTNIARKTLDNDNKFRDRTMSLQDNINAASFQLESALETYKEMIINDNNGNNDSESMTELQKSSLKAQRDTFIEYILDEIKELVNFMHNNDIAVSLDEVLVQVREIDAGDEYKTRISSIDEKLSAIKQTTDCDLTGLVKSLNNLGRLILGKVTNINKSDIGLEDSHSVLIDEYIRVRELEDSWGVLDFTAKTKNVLKSLEVELGEQVIALKETEFADAIDNASSLEETIEMAISTLKADEKSDDRDVTMFIEEVKEILAEPRKALAAYKKQENARAEFEEMLNSEWETIGTAAEEYISQLEVSENTSKFKQTYKDAVSVMYKRLETANDNYSQEEFKEIKALFESRIEEIKLEIENAKESFIEKLKAQKKEDEEEKSKNSNLELRLQQLPDNASDAVKSLFDPSSSVNIYALLNLANGEQQSVNTVMDSAAKIINQSSKKYFALLRKEFSRTNQEGYTKGKLSGQFENHELFYRNLVREQNNVLNYYAEFFKAFKYVVNNGADLSDTKEEIVEQLFEDCFAPLVEVATDLKGHYNDNELDLSLREVEELERSFYVGESTLHWLKTLLGEQLFKSGFFYEENKVADEFYLDIVDLEKLRTYYHDYIVGLLDKQKSIEYSTAPVTGTAFASNAQYGMNNDSGLMMSVVKWFKDKVADRDGQGTMFNTILTQTFDEAIFKMQGDNVEASDVFFLRLNDQVYESADNLDVYAYDNANHRYIVIDKEDVDFYDNIDLLGRTLDQLLSSPEYHNSDVARFARDYFRKLMLNELGKFMKLDDDFEEVITEDRLSEEQANDIVSQYIHVIENLILSINTTNKEIKAHFGISQENMTPTQIINAISAKLHQMAPQHFKDFTNDIAMSDKNRLRSVEQAFEMYKASLKAQGQDLPLELNFKRMKSLWQKSALHPRFHQFNVRYAKRLVGLVLEMHGVEAKFTELAKRIITSLYKSSKDATDPKESAQIAAYEMGLVNKLTQHQGDYAKTGVAVIFPDGHFVDQQQLANEKLEELESSLDNLWEISQEMAKKYLDRLEQGVVEKSLKDDYLGAVFILQNKLLPQFSRFYSGSVYLQYSSPYINHVTKLNERMTNLETAIATKQAEAEAAEMAALDESRLAVEKAQAIDDLNVKFGSIIVLAEKLIEAYLNNTSEREALESQFSVEKEKFEADFDLLKDEQENLAALIHDKDTLYLDVKNAKEKHGQTLDIFSDLTISSALGNKVNGGLDMSTMNTNVAGKLETLSWQLSDVKAGVAMTFDVVSFKTVNAKTVLASL